MLQSHSAAHSGTDSSFRLGASGTHSQRTVEQIVDGLFIFWCRASEVLPLNISWERPGQGAQVALYGSTYGKDLTDVRTQYGSHWWLRLDGKTQETFEYVRAVGTVDPRVRCVWDLAAFCGIFRTPSTRTLSASDADARCWVTELGAVVRCGRHRLPRS